MRPNRTWEEAVEWLLGQVDQQQLVRDCYLDRPPIAGAARYASSDEWREVLTLLPDQCGVALDVGAGHGITSYALACAGWRVTAVEPDASDIVGRGAIRALARSADLNIDVREGAGERLPARASEFDLVLARQVLHHARDLGEMARECYRVLRPGGTFVALRDHVISKAGDLEQFLRAHPLNWLYGGENAFTMQEYRKALTSAGFRIVRVLRHFDSVVNYAPHTLESLRGEVLSLLPAMRSVAARILRTDFGIHLTLKFLSLVDWRPGRLVSFVCEKPSDE